ncbi:MAG: hypothetical protein UR96_C0010G0008 [candidate division WS6 bacterium GW2011_GWC1_36_11]|uniref:Uncharacterized protein n=2 Tax=Candidatus Dojkabacteria TaxID=74243 RepID=A0A0G0FYV3_9BACT|nr:MAG: hypothetical protein UR96_C0010G0008 [candidate division WS6 bacterium GW2011_GWC1_36_11]KKQ04663.1 MAG: hypothetical protein US14_C0003G0026 [candidate division WS6 bacterium GW2011_WS6_36_26]KKQ16964.1 MAG: hypothetical protein US29_C0015G0008 [candidate division WS6 bacterium GW2011_GWF1_36_8]HAM96292.1 hypothetical protein [Patescibacteria group bacterium]
MAKTEKDTNFYLEKIAIALENCQFPSNQVNWNEGREEVSRMGESKAEKEASRHYESINEIQRQNKILIWTVIISSVVQLLIAILELLY